MALVSDRRRHIAAIHAAAAKLGMDTADKSPASDYRAMLQAVGGKASTTEMDDAALARVVKHLMRTLNPGGSNRRANPARPVRQALTAPQKLMWSLWQQLADAGEVENRKMPALLAYAQRQTGVARLEWLTPAQETLVVESLKQWRDRTRAAAKGAA